MNIKLIYSQCKLVLTQSTLSWKYVIQSHIQIQQLKDVPEKMSLSEIGALLLRDIFWDTR